MTEATNSSEAPVAGKCPKCVASLRGDEPRCWLCGSDLAKTDQAESLAASPLSPRRGEDALPTGGFSLASMMMFVTLVAVVMGLFSVAPGLGLLSVIALAPAALRYAWEIQRRKSRGQATTMNQKAVVFAASLGMVVVAGVAAATAFCATCFGGFFTGGALAPPGRYDFLIVGAVVGGTIGAILALWVFYRLMKRLAPKDSTRPSRWLFFAAIGVFLAAALVWWFNGLIDLFDVW